MEYFDLCRTKNIAYLSELSTHGIGQKGKPKGRPDGMLSYEIVRGLDAGRYWYRSWEHSRSYKTIHDHLQISCTVGTIFEYFLQPDDGVYFLFLMLFQRFSMALGSLTRFSLEDVGLVFSGVSRSRLTRPLKGRTE